MRVLITGASGQLGTALRNILAEQGFTYLDVPRYDITEHSVVQQIADHSPDVVIHAAAMTHVDGCARDPDAAFGVNAFGAQNVAHACMRCNADMVYVSSNEVFDGTASEPYREDAPTNPINPYASSKRSGEKMVGRYVQKLYIVRTAWVYSPGGNNFPAKIIGAADKYGKLRVVNDEVGNPTYAPDLAQAILKLIKTRAYDTYHFTNEGACSRFEFAQEILRLAGRGDVPLVPIPLSEYPRDSVVPPFTPLLNINGANLGITLPTWQEALQDYFARSSFPKP